MRREIPTRKGKAQATTDHTVDRRLLRSKYLSFKNRISDERDDISKFDSHKLITLIEEVDSLHQLVQNPREQVVDAEALFDITDTLVTSVKAYTNDGLTPSEFVSCILRDFRQEGGGLCSYRNELRSSIRWEDIGEAVSVVFRSAPGCRTMVGPMNNELKRRKPMVRRERAKLAKNTQPEELDEKDHDKTATDKNMATMFNVLRKNRKAKLENLMLNRKSFAQTVENLFALSFLIKDGRAEILVDASGQHLVSPKNAPSADAIQSGESAYSHFIFRFDFNDWKSMLDTVAAGEEIMPHRAEVNEARSNAEAEVEFDGPQVAQPSSHIRKLCRNRGLVMREQTVEEVSPESDGNKATGRATAMRRGKRKL
ncbi:non-structural maintenance of chromosomes element 4 homolog A [Salvia hispanica]|uniref:non-structural maintenance of chromosomes element 4 homolog A n=1 Tax=Salvia hispanica TaxID=49212 RepID=UPI0020095985|nr:non-structural maintenance of chromosomes element 4 homolog A [Salvia hispanica]XP_047943814.1 non-structural maintenance of chromosomes element 4 homolog A [Salvia hispanica]